MCVFVCAYICKHIGSTCNSVNKNSSRKQKSRELKI